jgi:anti-sigma factor RsiW
MSCDRSLRTQAWLDGELAEPDAAELERHVESCAECQSLAANAALVSDALRQASRHRAPAHLRARLSAALERETKRPRRQFWLGAASGGGVTALAAALALFAILPPSAASLTETVVAAHGRALTTGKIIMVASSNHHTVKPWLAEHVAISPPAADLSADGFILAGGRKDAVAGKDAAVAVYYSGRHEIDLFTWVDHGETLPQPQVSRGFRTSFWKSGDLDFAAVSDVSADAFEKFVALSKVARE